ncbi:MAG: Uma2 family endonuclease [Gloeomargarita sp. HHBFW_bins_162]
MMISVEKPKPIPMQWQSATWEDYENIRDDVSLERVQLFFYDQQLWVENMGWEGIVHSEVRELMALIIGTWLMQHPELKSKILGSCLMEKPGLQAAAPDIALYLGENLPQYQPGASRSIDLNQYQVPNLVVEISDTTLDSDLDQKKHLYAELGIPEYWVIDAQGGQVFIFVLRERKYLKVEDSPTLTGFTSTLLSQTIAQLKIGTNTSVAAWFLHQFQRGESQ